MYIRDTDILKKQLALLTYDELDGFTVEQLTD
jgi:hypothetical protein